MAVSEQELAEKLMQAGQRLQSPPSVEELLPLLDHLQHSLERVEQSPSRIMQDAIAPSMKALVTSELLGHADPDVKVSVATCISEITRITAPDSPYDDDQMKEIFRVVVSSFEELHDKSSRSFNKRTSILETVARVRSCLLMLDLECDTLILEMFQHFLKSVRDYHPEDVFSSMETIMTLVLEESEEISPELLSSILQYLKKDNSDVQPVAQKLAEKVLVKCAEKVKPYLLQASDSLGISLNDYKEVVANVCQASSGAAERNNISVANDSVGQVDLHKQPSEGTKEEAKEISKGSSPLTVALSATDSASEKLNCSMSNGNLQKVEEDPTNGRKESRGQEDGDHTETKAAEESNKVNTESKEAEESNKVNTESKDADESSKVNTESKDADESSKVNVGAKDAEESSKVMTETEAAEESSKVKNETEVPEGSSKAQAETEAAEESNKDKPDDAELIVELQRKDRSIRKRGRKAKSSKSSLHAAEVTPAQEGKSADKMTDDRENKDIKSSPRDAAAVDAEANGDRIDDAQQPKPKTSEGEGKIQKGSVEKISENLAVDVSSTPAGGRGKKNKNKIQKVTNDHGDASKKEDESTSDLDSKSTTQLGQKAELVARLSGEKKKGRGKGKAVSRKDLTKTSSKDEESNPSPKVAAKSAKKEPMALSSKRKRTEDTEKESDSDEYGENLVGSKIKVWWPDDQEFYVGVVESFDPEEVKHKIDYVDGDIEVLDLKMEKWEFVTDDKDSDKGNAKDDGDLDASPEIPMKKAKTVRGSSSKKGKSASSAKKGRGGASASKAKVTSSTPGRKQKSESKIDMKSKDSSKNTEGAKGGSALKSGESKGAKDIVDENLEGDDKSDDSDADTPLGIIKSKQQAAGNSSKSKGKTPKGRGSKSNNTNGASKAKVDSPAKGKETTKKAKKPAPEAAKSAESGKLKSPSTSSKAEKSGAKSGRKRQRGN